MIVRRGQRMTGHLAQVVAGPGDELVQRDAEPAVQAQADKHITPAVDVAGVVACDGQIHEAAPGAGWG